MKPCQDKKIKGLLHNYELGLLSDADRELVDQHILVCDECFENISNFQDVARHLRYSSDIKKTIEELADEDSIADSGKAKRPSLFKVPSLYIPALVTAITLFLFLILKPWNIEISPTNEAMASENRLVIINFNNLTGEPEKDRLGEIIASLLVTDLSNSRYIQTVSSQGLYDIMKNLGLEYHSSVGRSEARQIAQKAHVRWFITGNILQAKPNLKVNYEIVEAKTDNVLAANQITGLPGEDLFALIDRLTVDIKHGIDLSEDFLNEPDRKVADITTHSPKAYLNYLDGLEDLSKMYTDAASEKFLKAIEYDSTFAMAYYQLARIKSSEYIDYALKYIDNTTSLEKYYIKAAAASIDNDLESYENYLQTIVKDYPDEKEAYLYLSQMKYNQGEYKKSLSYVQTALKIDPLYKEAFNQLAYTYDRMGDFENSIMAINKYIELVPNEANPYDSRGDLYAGRGMIRKAIESYQKALAIKPNFFYSLRNLGNMYLILNNVDSASFYYGLIMKIDSGECFINGTYEVKLYVYQGMMDQSLAVFDSLFPDFESCGSSISLADLYRLRSLIHYEKGDLKDAIDEMQKSIVAWPKNFPYTLIDDRSTLVKFLAEDGKYAEAEKIIDSLYQDYHERDRRIYHYWLARGSLAFARGKFEDAIHDFEMVTKEENTFPTGYFLGQSYLEIHNYEKAVSVLEQTINTFDPFTRHYFGAWYVKLHYYLGLAYENSKWYDKAKEQYAIFIDYWKKADCNPDMIADAKARLERLKQNS